MRASKNWMPDMILPGTDRLVVEFRLSGPRPGRSWIVADAGEVSLCLDDPCLEVDLVVTADTATLYQVCMRRLAMSSAIADDMISITGPRGRVRSFLQVVDATSPPYMVRPGGGGSISR